MIAELLGGVGTDHLLHRTGRVQIARSLQIAVAWSVSVEAPMSWALTKYCSHR
jgi:hypothetical protein